MTTASRVFAGHTNVSESTRVKVLAAAEELGYAVNGLARAMMGAGQRSLAFVTSSIDSPASAELMSGAEEVAAANGSLFFVALTYSDPDRKERVIATLREQRTAGVLLAGSTVLGKETEQRVADYATALAAVNAGVVLCGNPILASHPGITSVNYDQVGGMRAVVQHLVGKGHQRIAFLGWSNSTTANQRFLGYSLGMKSCGLTIDSSLVAECPNQIVDAHLAALLLLNSANPPTAIVCPTDHIAMGVYRAARDTGVSIPDQLAVTGFDDSPWAGDLTPPLTSVHVPFRELGAQAARLALKLSDDTRVSLTTELIVRESSG